MQTLAQAKQNFVYQVERIETEEKTKRHLQNIGVVVGSKIVVVNLSGNNAILLIKSHRVAVSREILSQIFVNKKTASSESWTSLDQLKAGETGIVVAIHGQGAVKRRLMDMGLTRNVKIVIRKLAPLGDPIELTVRGYELTLRKSEAELILVQQPVRRQLARCYSRKKRRIVEKKSEHSHSRPTRYLFFVSLYTRRSDCKRLFGS